MNARFIRSAFTLAAGIRSSGMPPPVAIPEPAPEDVRSFAVQMFRHLGATPEDAEDFAHELLVRGAGVTWRAARHLYADCYRARHALKRGGFSDHVSVDEAGHVSSAESEAMPDRTWARRILSEATEGLNVRAESLLANEKPDSMDRLQWHRLKRRVAARILACIGDEAPRYFCQALCA